MENVPVEEGSQPAFSALMIHQQVSELTTGIELYELWIQEQKDLTSLNLGSQDGSKHLLFLTCLEHAD